jgi:hypothetical protein
MSSVSTNNNAQDSAPCKLTTLAPLGSRER